ncbi:MAG: type IX secretion system protein PorQ [Chlorobi bacterium]|nr:type IX secretion system protein PorQ [Chlorobiota bacterium]
MSIRPIQIIVRNSIISGMLLFLFLMPRPVISQTGGYGVYRFLELPWYPRAAALGGTVVSLPDTSINNVLSNPSLLNAGMPGNLSVNYTSYFAGIGFGSAITSFRLPVPGTFAAGVTFIRYGEFTAADENGMITGTFRAAEYSLPLSYARTIDSLFSAGVTIRPVFSSLEQYHSFGISIDIGASWHSRSGLSTAGILIRNLGVQLTSYVPGHREPVPAEILAGFSQKLQYAPFRFVLTARQLQRPNLIYKTSGVAVSEYNPTGMQTGSVPEGFGRVTENFMRHIIAGIEFLPMQNMSFSFGYNYQRRKELQTASRVGMVGFSWGFRLHISKFTVSYGRATYHLAGASNQFSVSTGISRFFPGGL